MATIRPIRDDDDLKAALEEIDRLWDCAPGTDDEATLEVLSILVHDYERRRLPTKASDPVEILRYAISDMGRTQKELADILGSASRASEILARKRRLNLAQIRRIAAAWKLPIELLAAPCHAPREKEGRPRADAAE